MAAKKPSKEIDTDLAAVELSIKRMNTLIDDLLKTAAGDSPTFVMKRERVDLSVIIREVAAELSPLIVRKKLAFKYEPPADLPPVLGDADKLKETFNNFLDNAIKYNREGGAISVTHKVDGEKVHSEINDTGRGISQHALEKLFAPFYRGDAGKDIVGTGLGLFMTRKLVQKMDGQVTVRSEECVGTTFTVTLPRA